MATVFAALVLVAAACGDDAGTTTAPPATTVAIDTTMPGDMDMGGEHTEFAFGEPMDASMADRVIEIAANDDFSFVPASVTVTVGETVTFRVTNTGVIPHDFALGDAEMQDEHEAEMETFPSMVHHEPNVFSLEPGATMEMTWRFTEAGELIFGCHQTGHYAAGMKGTVTVGAGG